MDEEEEIVIDFEKDGEKDATPFELLEDDEIDDLEEGFLQGYDEDEKDEQERVPEED